MSLPLLYLSFANNPQHPLAHLTKEAQWIEQALQRVENGAFQVKKDEFATLDVVAAKLRDFHDRVVLLHYGGHADGRALLLSDDAAAGSEGVATLLQQQKHLKLVFLNGCSTRGQVARLLELGIPAVLATATPVGDEVATEVARLFYEAMAGGMSIGEAFGHLEGYCAAQGKEGLLGRYRSLALRQEQRADERPLPWGLYCDDEKALAWRLRDASLLYTFNQHLTRSLTIALQQNGNRMAEKFLEGIKTRVSNPNWETESIYTDIAKALIASNFVGLVGSQLDKIFAIGKRPADENKQADYIQNCVRTALKVLQLLCFALLSKLWDHLKENKARPLPPEQVAALSPFFRDTFEHNIERYGLLLQTLLDIFRQQPIDFPLPELATFAQGLQTDDAFQTACKATQRLWEALEKSNHSLTNCHEAELQLCKILEATIFLARYKMVSIKSIDYHEMRGTSPRYLHRYASLELNKKTQQITEEVNYAEDTVATDAVLLFKGRYQESVNLFPFVIDLNSLLFEGGAKIACYAARDLTDNSLNYRFLADNLIHNILYKNVARDAPDLNELMKDAEKRKQLKLDVLYEQFRDAEKTILGESPDDVFDDLFTEDA